MKTIKDILKLSKITTLIIPIALTFSACGGGGGGGDSASFSNSETIIDIDVVCVTNNPSSTNIDTYITLQSEDVIVKDEDNTTISIFHDVNGNKKVCIVGTTGKAHIVRK